MKWKHKINIAMFVRITLLLPGILLFFTALSQPHPDFSGTWKGTSLCQIKESPCHDETVVYHISRQEAADHFRVTMNKIVNGREEDMADWIFKYDTVSQTLRYVDTARDAVWTLYPSAKKMEGNLYFRRQLFRLIRVEKD